MMNFNFSFLRPRYIVCTQPASGKKPNFRKPPEGGFVDGARSFQLLGGVSQQYRPSLCEFPGREEEEAKFQCMGFLAKGLAGESKAPRPSDLGALGFS